MTAASVPSTLVKCLYLFFDLTVTDGDHDDDIGADNDVTDTNNDTEFTGRERRVLLQKMMMQVLLRQVLVLAEGE